MLDATGTSMSVEARVSGRKRMLALKKESDLLAKENDAAKAEVARLRRSLPVVAEYNSDVVPPPTEDVRPISLWLLGMPLAEGSLGKCFYGVFSVDDAPPARGWAAFGEGDASRPTVRTTIKAPPPPPGGGAAPSAKPKVSLWLVEGCGNAICMDRANIRRCRRRFGLAAPLLRPGPHT